MFKIEKHPILTVPSGDTVTFKFNGEDIVGERGLTIAAALHQAGYPVHSYSLTDRNRSLECGIGKCGACEMLVDGNVRRICITKVDNVKEVSVIPKDYSPKVNKVDLDKQTKIYKTTVAIIGAGPAGLATREILNSNNVDNIVIDNNDRIGGQFTMQTHQFFFFESEKKFGGMRGFDIAETLAGDDRSGIILNTTIWDILEGKRLAAKNIVTDEIFYIDADHLVIATGAVPFMPAFENDDLPGVYTAAVVQKMMNNEFTLLGKNILTVGAGNIGYLTSYQAIQAGAKVKAIIEAMPHEGGFPVQANRVRRLGIPIYTSHVLLKAIPNTDHTGVVGAVIAEAKDFKPVPGTEKIIDGVDLINICTGLVPDNQLLIKGKEIFGRYVYGVGDAVRIGEGTSAVLRGKQAAFEILEDLGKRYNYNDFLRISKEYIDSQQHPTRIIEKPYMPSPERMKKPFVMIDCLYGFACNPCAFACPHGAITKTSSSTVPQIDYNKCIGCMICVTMCPGLAIFGYNVEKQQLFLPVEYEVAEGAEVFIVNNNGEKLGEGVVEKVMVKPNKTNLARVKVTSGLTGHLTEARGFIIKENYPKPIIFSPYKDTAESEKLICHCEDVSLDEILKIIGDRKFISIDEIKHITRLGMGACRGKRCIKRLKTALAEKGIQIVGEATPRGPMSNQLSMGEIYPKSVKEQIIVDFKGKAPRRVKTQVLIAGGGMAGSSLFRYAAEAGMKPVLINYGRGSSWRNIAGGRPAFSVPELADIAVNNLAIFKELQKISNINFHQTNYISFAHDQATYEALDKSREWSNAYMITPAQFQKEISESFNPNGTKYLGALVTKDCWQATPGLTIDLIRNLGIKDGGEILEDCKLIRVEKVGNKYVSLVKDHNQEYIEYESELFVNALGYEADKFARQLGYETGLYPVKHQAFITRRLPMLGVNGKSLDMLIDRRHYKGFTAVYGQQLAETGQIIGCASPANDPMHANQPLTINDKDFLNIVSEVFCDWIPQLTSVGMQAVWAGYYVEPRMIVDPAKGLMVGLLGHGFMLSMYLAKMYIQAITGQKTSEYFQKLSLEGEGIKEGVFK
ncbi:MAG TPA: FAD-dependent oxidoreductase [Salinivirgaceae bacterium]|nr:FAD-dependent oxidoreductase [Salinivirgaceae bacterium]